MQSLVSRRYSMTFSLAAAAALCWAAPAAAQARRFAEQHAPNASSNEPVFQITAPKQNELTITERFAKVVELKARIVRVDGFDPEVIGVTALTPTTLRVQAIKPGVTTIVLIDENAATWTVDVFVVGDVRHLQAYLSQLFPRSSVEAVAVRDAVVLRGWVSQPEHITDMVEIAEQFYPKVLNQMRVGGVQQVLLRVKVMEVQRAKIRKLGINFLFHDATSASAILPGGITPLASAAAAAPVGGAITPPTLDVAANSLKAATSAFGVVGPNGAFQGFVEALKTESLLKILAEPELTATNGRPAHMLAGGEFPILVPSGLGTTTVQWREFGVRLEAVPIILGAGRVRLDLQPEVSDRDFTNAATVNGITVPALTTRKVNTQVEMKFGETFMLAGLLSMRDSAETDKVPLFGELPWIGAIFRRVNYQEAETELVIMVTPELIGPTDPSMLPPGGPGRFTDVPTDRELYCQGLLEVPKYGDECLGNCGPGGVMNAGYASGQPNSIDPVTFGRPGLIPPNSAGPAAPADGAPPPDARKSSDIERTGGFRPANGPYRPAPRVRGRVTDPNDPAARSGVSSDFTEPNMIRSPAARATRKPGLIEPQ